MSRSCWFCVILLMGVSPTAIRAEVFDHYLNKNLSQMVESKNVKEIKQLTPVMIVEHDRVLPKTPSAFLILRTNGGRFAKLLVQAGKQKIDDTKSLPILSIEQFVTYKEGEEQTILARGNNQSLFAGFHFSFDLGQVVPEAVGGDLKFVVQEDKIATVPVGKARLYLVTKHDPSVEPKKGKGLVMSDKFEARYFNGTYRLFDDGRRTGKLVLQVDDGKRVTGAYYSDKDGQKYEVSGKVGNPLHEIEFRIKFPRTEQQFRGMLFTGNGKAIAGTSRLIDRETAFYAVREE